MTKKIKVENNAATRVGRRNSARRAAIVSVLERSTTALTPDEVHNEATKLTSSLGIATVYRNLKLLLESKIVQRIILPDGQLRYELVGKKHHCHFQCNLCGRAYCLVGCALATKPSVILPDGFVADGHEITYLGTCARCNDDKERE